MRTLMPGLLRSLRERRAPRLRRTLCRVRLLASVLLCAYFCCIFAFAGTAEPSGTEDTVETALPETAAEGARAGDDAGSGGVLLAVECGYGGAAKGGRSLPVHVRVENDRDRALSGTLRVKTRESDGTICWYEYEAQAAPGGAFSAVYYIPLGASEDTLFVSLLEENGSAEEKTELAAQEIELAISRDVPDLFIGILSDAPEELLYLDGVGIRYSALRTRTFTLEAADIPEDRVGLDQLDVLAVNNYRLRDLSEKQAAAVMDWVKAGGVLLLGTGERVDDTLGRFAPELLDESYDAPVLRHINLAEDYADVKTPEEAMLSLICASVSLHGGSVILSSSGFPLLTAAAKEQGLVAVAAFDLGGIAGFAQNHSSYVDHLFTELLGEARIDALAGITARSGTDAFSAVQKLVETGSLGRMPNLPLYAAVVAVYLILIGPGLYFFLRGRRLQAYYRRFVLLTALVFAGLIYLLGTSTRFRSTFCTYASIQDVTEDYVTDMTFVSIRSPYSRPYSLALNAAFSITPVTRSLREPSQSADSVGDGDWQLLFSHTEGGLTLYGQDIPAFSSRCFEMERKKENTEAVGVTGELCYSAGGISGTLTNHYPFPLENTAIFLYGTLAEVGRIGAGEEKSLDGTVLLHYPLGNAAAAARQVSGEAAFASADIKNSEYLTAAQRSNLLAFYLENYLTGYTADARLTAFSGQNEEGAFLAEPAETFGLTMITAALSVSAAPDAAVYRCVLMRQPRIVSGFYEAASNSMRGLEPLTLEYQLGTDIAVESLTFEGVSEVFEDGQSESRIFSGGIYFYNYASGNFDRMEEIEDRALSADELVSYLSPGNTVTVRYVYEGTGGRGLVQLPMPMVSGSPR